MKSLSKVSSHFLKSNKRFLSSLGTNTRDAFENFDTHSQRRCSEAQKSIVVHIPSVGCAEHVFRQCSAVGQVSSLFHYTTFNGYTNRQQDLLLVEFLDPGCVQEMMYRVPISSSSYLPVRSPFFQYNGSSHGLSQASDGQTASQASQGQSVSILTAENLVSDKGIKENLFSCSSVSGQMQLYYDCKRLSDLGYRLRFLTCRQIELLLSGVFPLVSVLPFGSSVNGFGHNRSDLDMVIKLETPEMVACSSLPEWAKDLQLHAIKEDPCWHKRSRSAHFLELAADLLKLGAPGCSKVFKILRARVPIVKYEQQLTGLDCDLSVSNWSGLYMSELLYQYNTLDPRVGPLLFALRLWAKEAGITNKNPGRWITNFSLTTLALYYLVFLKILPTFNVLKNHARPEDERVDEKGMSCTYLRSLSTIASIHQQPESTRALSLEDLLYGFFCFYDEFNFKMHGLSIVSGEVFNKPDLSALYMQNPLDGSLNVSRNVTLEEVERFSLAVAQARYTLKEDAPQSSRNWGLLTLLSSSGQRPKRIMRIDLNEIVGGGTSSPTGTSSTSATTLSTANTAQRTTGNHNSAAKKKAPKKSQLNSASSFREVVDAASPTRTGKHCPSSSKDKVSLKNSHQKNSVNDGNSRKRKDMLMQSPK